jgi:ABC-type multidrug transport system fused ATPase/permease subunit
MRDRIALLSHLRDAGLSLLAALGVVHLVTALVPPATAITMAYLIRAGGTNIMTAAIAMGAVVLFGQVALSFQQPLSAAARTRIDGAFRTRIAALVLAAPTIDVLERQDVQNLIKTATAEPTEWVTKTPADGALGQLRFGMRYLSLILCAAVLAAWSWWLVPALVIPAVTVRVLVGHGWVRHFRIWSAGVRHHRWWHYWGEIATSPAEGKELRVFGARDWVLGRFDHHVRAHLLPVWADDRTVRRDHWLRMLIPLVPLALAYVWVGLGAADGRESLALAAAVLTAGWSLFVLIGATGDVVALEGAAPAVRAGRELERLFRRAAPHPAPAPRPVSGDAPPYVRLEQVRFGYPGSARPVLDGLDLEIRPGELLAVVGLNGAGKSTLTKLLAGLYRPSAGRITADGVDIADIPGWRSRLAIVYQDFVRYHLSLEQNIALGAVDRAALAAAAADAGLGPLAERLPRGYDTPLATAQPGGVDLSGGQWQLVALARALYATKTRARLLVLDEPSAHLDVRTEHDLFQRLDGIIEGLSVMLISHRLATVRQADRIVLLDGGRITESGSHEELVAHGGRYAEMWWTQSRRFVQGFEDRLDAVDLS